VRILRYRLRVNTLLHSIQACRSAVLPGGRLAFRVGATQVGWVLPDVAAALTGLAGIRQDETGLVLDAGRAHTLPTIGRMLSKRGLCRWRDEAFDVRAHETGPVLAQVDRGCLVVLGMLAQGIHMDGVVRAPDGLHVWIATRSASKALDPGKQDHLVAGGVPAGLSPWQMLLKEAAEEAAIAPALAERARNVGRFTYAMERPDGLRRDIIHCYELELPADFVPHPVDGEIEGFTLWRLDALVAAVRGGIAFKFNVMPVLIGLFLRHGAVTGAEAEALRQALEG
jgi:8-oxo-dGTP pyrophosphatase MutT (NUDIX family)